MPVDFDLTQKIVDFMNEIVRTDPQPVTDLIEARVNCNRDLAFHSTVQVMANEKGGYQVGLLGLLNGLCGKHDTGEYKGWGGFVAEFDDEWRVLRFIAIDENGKEVK